MARMSKIDDGPDIGAACRFVGQVLDWVSEEWDARGPKGFYPNPDETDMMRNIMGEVADVLGEMFGAEVGFAAGGYKRVTISGITAQAYSTRSALCCWLARARFRLALSDWATSGELSIVEKAA